MSATSTTNRTMTAYPDSTTLMAQGGERRIVGNYGGIAELQIEVGLDDATDSCP